MAAVAESIPERHPAENPMQEKLRRFKAGIFQALAHPTRIAIIELLRDEGELPVTTVYERLGLEQPNASQHLAVLRAKHLVVARKRGNQVYYSLRDRIIGKVLDLMREYFHSHLTESLDLLNDMATDRRRKPVGRTKGPRLRADFVR
jgi:ArsR family transcriptional regulator